MLLHQCLGRSRRRPSNKTVYSERLKTPLISSADYDRLSGGYALIYPPDYLVPAYWIPSEICAKCAKLSQRCLTRTMVWASWFSSWDTIIARFNSSVLWEEHIRYIHDTNSWNGSGTSRQMSVFCWLNERCTWFVKSVSQSFFSQLLYMHCPCRSLFGDFFSIITY